MILGLVATRCHCCYYYEIMELTDIGINIQECVSVFTLADKCNR